MSIELAKQLPGTRIGSSSASQWLSRMADEASRYGRSVWAALEAAGSRRAEREMGRLAALHAADPEISKVYRDAARNLQSQNH